MFRRQFIQLIALAGAGRLAATAAVGASENHETVTYRVKGFTCITCAVGLETLLRQQKGVVWAKASYPDAMVTIQFNSESVTENALRKFISEMGFTAELVHGKA